MSALGVGGNMARVFWVSGTPDYANAGEKRVVERLLAELPETFVLIPNITVPFASPSMPEEYDVIVVAEDAIFVVETKDWAGRLEFTDQEVLRNGTASKNPYSRTRLKAQKLSSLLKSRINWFGSGGWVEALVVLAREPEALTIAESMHQRIARLGNASAIVGPGSPVIGEKYHGQLKSRADELVAAITGGASKRERRTIFGRFSAGSRIFEQGNLAAWSAKDSLTGEEVVLEVHARPHGLPTPTVNSWKDSRLELFNLMREIGPSADLDGPREAFEHDDGSIVTVWPGREDPLDGYLNAKRDRGESLTSQEARRIIAGYVSALLHLHSNGWILGATPPHNVFVRSNGRGGFAIGGERPSRNADTSGDMRFLAAKIDVVLGVVRDDVLSNLSKALKADDPTDIPSIVFVLAALQNAVELETLLSKGRNDHLRRFDIDRTLAKHPFGSTALAFDKTLSKKVLLKYESQRPAGDWVLREYRTLTHPRLVANPGVARFLAGDSLDGFSYLATEYVDAPSLATAIDAGVFTTPTQIQALAFRLLEVVEGFHPDVEATIALLDQARGELTIEQEDQLAALRDGGIAHNLIEPSNIFLDENRGVVLVDFTRGGRFGERIPQRTANFWPSDLPFEVSDPRADLYAVGGIIKLLLDRLSTTAPKFEANEKSVYEHLRKIAEQATEQNAADRFVSARKFIIALGVESTSVALPEAPKDVWELQQAIDLLVAELKFDEALALCPAGWIETRQSIEAKRALVGRAGQLLLEIDGVTLSHVGRVEIPPGVTGKNIPHEGGEAEVYVVSEPGGGHFEVRVRNALVDGVIEEWVGIEQAVAEPPRMQHAVRALRMNVQREKSGLRWIELSQALLRKNPDYPFQASGKMVTEAKLQAALSSEPVERIFFRFGAEAFGKREEVLSDKSKRRNYLTVAYRNAVHMPAVAHFVCRIMPLYRGFEAD